MSSVVDPVKELGQPVSDQDGFVLPPISEIDGLNVPMAPEKLADVDVNPSLLVDLTLKLAHTVPRFTTEWASQKLCLPLQIVEEMCYQLKHDHLVEVLGQEGPFNYRYAATQRGREQAERLLEISGYVGPAPVSVEAYSAMLNWQSVDRVGVTFEDVEAAISELVLPPEAVEVAALSVYSGRSLFLFGPAGNGKTSLGRMLHRVFDGNIWIPYSICLDQNIIRVFDSHIHEPAGTPQSGKIDHRWQYVRRPFVVAGGEMTIEELDLAYSSSLRFYEAPPHVKANGGTFLIDDLGRQRVDAHDLLNRWIIPLEHRTDHLTLVTGQKLELPFRLMLIVATNLTVSEVADPAFLRRMGYRLNVASPTKENYAKIFRRYADAQNVKIETELIQQIIQRYETEERELRASEPRDLVERTRDICLLQGRPLELNQEVLDIAWRGYFGNSETIDFD